MPIPHPFVLWFFVVAVAARLFSLAVSVRHERQLKARGAREHDATTSKLLAAAHVVFYLAGFVEAWLSAVEVRPVGLVGVGLWVASMLALALVVRELGRLWTVKLIIAPDHELKTGSLFRHVRHPNYLLNIVPELIGYGLALQAWWTLAIGLPVYGVLLMKRIRAEEAVMQAAFPAYPGPVSGPSS